MKPFGNIMNIGFRLQGCLKGNLHQQLDQQSFGLDGFGEIAIPDPLKHLWYPLVCNFRGHLQIHLDYDYRSRGFHP